MLGEQDPTAGRRGKEEYRRDLPLGLGTSTIVHVSAVFMLLSGALVYTVSRTPEPTPVKSQIITIETLVRTPQSVVRPTRIVQSQKPIPVDVSRPTHTSMTARSASASALLPTPRVAAAPAHGSPAHSTGMLLLPRIKPAKAAKVYTAGTGSPTNTLATAPTTGQSVAASANDSYEPTRGHTGQVMSDRAPSGPLGGGGGDSTFGGITIGHGHDDCTPSRGGFFR